MNSSYYDILDDSTLNSAEINLNMPSQQTSTFHFEFMATKPIEVLIREGLKAED